MPTRAELPPVVAKKRNAIVAAARAFDYDGLETLLDRKAFSYSFGESGDPVGYWRRLEEEGPRLRARRRLSGLARGYPQRRQVAVFRRWRLRPLRALDVLAGGGIEEVEAVGIDCQP
jgi:hypothetical protein